MTATPPPTRPSAGVAHTSGPWSVEIDDQSGIGRTHAVYVCSAAGWPEGQLARVNAQDGLGEREANARLIAAAPDLLEALQTLIPSNVSLGNDNWSDSTIIPIDFTLGELRQARAAILRATGATS